MHEWVKRTLGRVSFHDRTTGGTVEAVVGIASKRLVEAVLAPPTSPVVATAADWFMGVPRGILPSGVVIAVNEIALDVFKRDDLTTAFAHELGHVLCGHLVKGKEIPLFPEFEADVAAVRRLGADPVLLAKFIEKATRGPGWELAPVLQLVSEARINRLLAMSEQ